MTNATPGVVHATDATFHDEVEHTSGLVVVDFHASWCPPCKLISPVIDELASVLEGRAKVVKVDVDVSPESAARYLVRSIPNVMYFKDGERVDSIVGATTLEQYVARAAQHSKAIGAC